MIDRGVRYVSLAHAAYFEREYLYGAASRDYPDNPERFAFLSQAALTWAASTGQPYDIVHAHDWQAGLVPLMVRRTVPAWRAPAVPATVFTIHNLAYQGVFDASWLPRLGLGWDLMRVDALEFWNRISFLKGGIMFAGVITTVSPGTPTKSRPRNSALGSTASCAPVRPIWSAFSTESITINGIPSGT